MQYELKKDATSINLGLIRQFGALGYESYRLVPGLNLLAPFDATSQPDPYLLNLFCCKAARAARLAARGLLLRASDLSGADASAPGSGPDSRYHWSNALVQLPYAAPFAAAWREGDHAADSALLVRGLALYSRSRDVALPSLERFEALNASFTLLVGVCKSEPSHLRLATLARVAHDYGSRAVGVMALKQLLEHIRRTGFDPNEPFLPPLERFDIIPSGADPASWLIASILEHLEKREHYSTFYVGPTALARLEAIHALGFGGPEMERRLELVRLRIELARQKRPD